MRLPAADRDIHFLPQYGLIYRETYGYEPFLAFYGDEDHFVIQPFIKRALNQLPFLKDQHVTKEYYDVTNPYGYGGPLTSADPVRLDELLSRFQEHLLDCFRQQELASEFTSCHPLIGNHTLAVRAGVNGVSFQKTIVYLDLTVDEKEIWGRINRGHRSSIQRAKNRGVRIEKVEPDAKAFAIFNALYFRTMKRTGAADRWFFPEDYFANCSKLLGPERTSLFLAYVGDQIASAYFLMHDFSTAYYHFGASDDQYFDFRPNNLLMYETALWAKSNGYTRYHLGGGVTSSPTDSLFAFKHRFSGSTAELYTYSRVLHDQTYEELCSHKIAHEQQTLGHVLSSDYFPAYRR
jgi:hypothetical protein